jgi:hypothetical protein
MPSPVPRPLKRTRSPPRSRNARTHAQARRAEHGEHVGPQGRSLTWVGEGSRGQKRDGDGRRVGSPPGVGAQTADKATLLINLPSFIWPRTRDRRGHASDPGIRGDGSMDLQV